MLQLVAGRQPGICGQTHIALGKKDIARTRSLTVAAL